MPILIIFVLHIIVLVIIGIFAGVVEGFFSSPLIAISAVTCICIYLGRKSNKEIEFREQLNKQSKIKDEADLRYYQQHKEDKDTTGLDKDRMQHGLILSTISQIRNYPLDDKVSKHGRSLTNSSIHSKHEILIGSPNISAIKEMYQKDIDDAYRRDFCFVDTSGFYRHWGDDFIDYKGNWCKWGVGGTFYDKEFNFRQWGDEFIDGNGEVGSLDDGFYDAAGNWVPGRNQYK